THEGAAEGDRRGEAREEHEQIGGVAEAEARRDDAPQPIVVDMRREDDEQGGAAEEIEPRVAAGRWRAGHDTLCWSGRGPSDRRPKRFQRVRCATRKRASASLPPTGASPSSRGSWSGQA